MAAADSWRKLLEPQWVSTSNILILLNLLLKVAETQPRLSHLEDLEYS